MGICAHCGSEEMLPFSCKFCGGQFCGLHRLPENHACAGLVKFKEERGKEPEKWIYEPFHKKYKTERPGRKVKKPVMEVLLEKARRITARKVLYMVIVAMFAMLIIRGLR